MNTTPIDNIIGNNDINMKIAKGIFCLRVIKRRLDRKYPNSDQNAKFLIKKWNKIIKCKTEKFIKKVNKMTSVDIKTDSIDNDRKVRDYQNLSIEIFNKFLEYTLTE